MPVPSLPSARPGGYGCICMPVLVGHLGNRCPGSGLRRLAVYIVVWLVGGGGGVGWFWVGSAGRRAGGVGHWIHAHCCQALLFPFFFFFLSSFSPSRRSSLCSRPPANLNLTSAAAAARHRSSADRSCAYLMEDGFSHKSLMTGNHASSMPSFLSFFSHRYLLFWWIAMGRKKTKRWKHI
ncbi:hypothetical protein F5Y15DRAFT_337919 [Xylariaceae sp. FL0016]|nr:hypothetical protein F5Y15DRAFT_337919 [Xylariaceae sp. FL0016]